MGGDRLRPASTAASRRRAPRRFAGPSTRKAPPGFGGPEARGPAGSFRRRRRSVGLVFLGAMPVEGAVAGIDREPPERAVAAAADGDFARSPVDPAVERRHRREDHEGAGEVPEGPADPGRGPPRSALRHRRSAGGASFLPILGLRSGSRRRGVGARVTAVPGKTRPGQMAGTAGAGRFIPGVGDGSSAPYSSARCLSPRRGTAGNCRNGAWQRQRTATSPGRRQTRPSSSATAAKTMKAAGEVPAGRRPPRKGSTALGVTAPPICGWGASPLPILGFSGPEVGGGESGRVPRPPPGEASPSGGARAPRGSGGRFRVVVGQSASYSSARCMSKAPWRGSTGNRRNSAWQR